MAKLFLAKRLDTKVRKKWNKDWINVGPTKWGGTGLDSDIVDINENYINYIDSNTKLVKETDVERRWQTQVQKDIIWPLTIHVAIRKLK